MSKYCYVNIVDPCKFDYPEDFMKDKKPSMLVSNYVSNYFPFEEGQGVLTLNDVKERKVRGRTKDRFGFPYTYDYSIYDPVTIICEDQGEYLEEIITGRKYESIRELDYRKIKPSDKLRFRPMYTVAPRKIVEIIKGLSNEDLERFRIGMINLENAVYLQYENEIEKYKEYQRQRQREEAFIKRFKDTRRK